MTSKFLTLREIETRIRREEKKLQKQQRGQQRHLRDEMKLSALHTLSLPRGDR